MTFVPGLGDLPELDCRIDFYEIRAGLRGSTAAGLLTATHAARVSHTSGGETTECPEPTGAFSLTSRRFHASAVGESESWRNLAPNAVCDQDRMK